MATAEIPKTNDNTQALAQRVREGSLAMQFGQAGLQLRHLEDAIAFAKQMLDGGLVPKGVNRPGAVIWMIQRGAELGLGPTTALDSFYIGPSGKPELYVKAALGICVARGALDENYEIWTEGEGEATVAFFKFRRRNWKEARIRKFAWLEGKQAQLTKKDSNWDKWPQRMCTARVVGFALKDYFSDVYMNCPMEGDDPNAHPAEVTEISRESLTPASVAPDPLFAQLENKTDDSNPADPWADFTASQANTTTETQSEESRPTEGEAIPPEDPPSVLNPEPMRKPRASKKDQDFFESLCRTRGMSGNTIGMFLGNHGYERIDEVPEDEMPKLIAAVKEIKPKTPATGNRT